MATVNVTVHSDGWTQLTSEMSYIAQPVTSNNIEVASSIGAPSDDLRGLVLETNHVISSLMMDSPLWGRSLQGSTIVSVTENA